MREANDVVLDRALYLWLLSGTNNNQSAVLLNYWCSRESETLQQKKKKRWFTQSFRLSEQSHIERCLVPIDSDKRRSTVDGLERNFKYLEGVLRGQAKKFLENRSSVFKMLWNFYRTCPVKASNDALTDDSLDEEVPANNMLEFSLDSEDDDKETAQVSKCSSFRSENTVFLTPGCSVLKTLNRNLSLKI
ncbi:hypothetical protein TNCV_68901 [Trichonephila clavipes]|nr:hypothetical protein TNCV_68901 [Trichonephila clavipes]